MASTSFKNSSLKREILCSSCKFKVKKRRKRIENCSCCLKLYVDFINDDLDLLDKALGINSFVRKECLLTNNKLCLNCNRKVAKNPDKIEENEVIKLFNCGRCKVISYCSKRCQKENHALHKKFCKAWVKTERDFHKALKDFCQRFYNPPPSNLEDSNKMMDNEQFQKEINKLFGDHNYELAVLGENVKVAITFMQSGLKIIDSVLFASYLTDIAKHAYISQLAGIYLLLGRFQEAYDLQTTWIIRISERRDRIGEILSGQDMKENIVEIVECLGLLEDFLGTECELAAFWFVFVIIKIKIIEDFYKCFLDYSKLLQSLSKDFSENQRLMSILTKYYFGSDLKTFLELLMEQESQLVKIILVICKIIVRTKNNFFAGIMIDIFVKKSHYHQDGLLGIAKYFSLKPEFKPYFVDLCRKQPEELENYIPKERLRQIFARTLDEFGLTKFPELSNFLKWQKIRKEK